MEGGSPLHLHEESNSRPIPSLALSTQIHWPRLPSMPTERGQWQARLAYLFLITLALLFVLVATVAYRYLLPQERWITLGHTTQFPIDQPQPIAIQNVRVWVVNTGEEFIVLDSMINDEPQYRVVWEGASWHEAQWYVDALRGARYTKLGLYSGSGPAPNRSLDRYPTTINSAGQLTINVSKPILGPTVQQLPQACTPHAGEDPDRPNLARMQTCDESWLQMLRAEKE